MRDGATSGVALAHDYLLVLRGAERVFSAMADCWPDAPISTLLYDEEATEGRFSGHEIHTSYLQRLGVRQQGFRRLLPFYPRAIEKLHVPDADVVVSSSSAFAHGLVPPNGAIHVCYCHSPFRYVWHERERAISEMPGWATGYGERLLDRVRDWDRHVSTRVTHYISNSELTRDRIREFYGRDSSVIHPPVAVDRFTPGEEHDDYFLVVCELVRHKNVFVALEAARKAGVPIKVVGTGPDEYWLRRDYPEADFLGRVSDAELADVYARARAFVMPAVEEFGIVAAEAHAAGRPVLAAGAGGALEIIREGSTGVFAEPLNVDAFAEAMRHVDWEAFDPRVIRARAEEFSVPVFQARLREEIDRAMGRNVAAIQLAATPGAVDTVPPVAGDQAVGSSSSFPVERRSASAS
ncbi:MAG: glycosyltransferase [Solirubrobacteraceae bacterium]|nr:glycosyltransferase [Solirubrobacteraceae bacterium]